MSVKKLSPNKVREPSKKKPKRRTIIPDPEYHDLDASESYLEARAQVRALMGKLRNN